MVICIERLRSTHDRTTFSCGIEALDRYLKQQASQDVSRRAAACFVAVEADDANGSVIGFYTLSASAIPLPDLPEALVKKLPRYPTVPVALIGRLAIDQRAQGRELGAALLGDAARRVVQADIMAYALVVDAKDANAEAFYAHHGFLPLPSASGSRLFLPLASIARALG
ncbi:MAG: GNAT family N-acetyltransferase [Thermomicrobiales bacterium]